MGGGIENTMKYNEKTLVFSGLIHTFRLSYYNVTMLVRSLYTPHPPHTLHILYTSEAHLAARELSEIPGALFSSSWASLVGLSRNLGVLWETLKHSLAVFWRLLAALGEKIIQNCMQDNAKNRTKLEIVCPDKKHSQNLSIS